MSRRARVALFFLGAVPLAVVLVAAFLGLPGSGRGKSRYGELVVGAMGDERKVADAVTAVNFDYRGFDTLGEEMIFFTAVIGVVVLLRRSSGDEASEEDEEGQPSRELPPTSDAVRVLGLSLVGATIAYGLYIVTHGQVTPGGGFQGGVVVATAWLILFLAGDAKTYRRLAPQSVFEAIEAVGAGAYALIGAGALLAGLAFLGNWVPLGKQPSVTSGGTIALLSVAAGFEITAGFVVLITTFVEEALSEREEE